MVLVLGIGDLHVPHRAADLPAKFKSLLVPGKIHHILCPGNLCTEAMHEYLRSICSDVVVTQGDFDGSTHWPETAVVSVGGLKIGLCHGHQVVPWGDADVLASLQRRMGIDILLTGHTHAFKAFERDGRLVINPGSGTGAPSTIAAGPPPVPSFVLMDVDGTKATIYVYELGPDEQVKVEKIEYAKKAPAL